MPEGVGRDGFMDTRRQGMLLDAVPEGLAGHALAAAGGKEVGADPRSQQVMTRRPIELFEPALSLVSYNFV